jgi:hypothetical protein
VKRSQPRRRACPREASLGASWAMRLTPEPFRDFLPYTSLSALKVVHTGQVLEHALQVVQHYGSEPARAAGAEVLAASMRAAGLPIQVARAAFAPLDATRLSRAARVAIGDQVLRLYFHQLYAQGPWFLDLRPRHFAWSEERQQLTFFPSGLWYRPEAEFRRRVQSLYEGFYRRDPSSLAAGIELYSWGTTPLAGFSERIERLLSEHFGAGETQPMLFSIAHFRETFERIFDEVARSRAKLHPELTFLGVGLVGLYLTLEQLQVPLEARQAFDASASPGNGGKGA